MAKTRHMERPGLHSNGEPPWDPASCREAPSQKIAESVRTKFLVTVRTESLAIVPDHRQYWLAVKVSGSDTAWYNYIGLRQKIVKIPG